NVLTKDDQPPFPIRFYNPAPRGNEEAAVEEFGIFQRLRPRFRFSVVSADNHPDMMLLSKSQDWLMHRLHSKQIRHRRLGPNQEIGFVGHYLLGKSQQFRKTFTGL